MRTRRRGRRYYVPDIDIDMDAVGMLVKRVIYILCFVWLCYLDHIIGTATGFIQFSLKNYTGVVIGIIILTAYKPKDFLKVPYYIWLALFFVCRLLALNWAKDNVANIGEFESIIWNVGIYGVILIRMLYGWIAEKKRVRMNWPVFSVWLIWMLLMVIAGKGVAWPKWFLLFWGCFYLTDFSKKDLNNLFMGMTEGLIIGFLLVQGNACMHRPYDSLRYEGMYSNSNINALFYLTVYGATLVKWYQMKLMGRSRLSKLPIIILVGILFSLTFFTMGRTALIIMILITGIFLVFQVISQNRNRIRALLIDCSVIAVTVILCFVPTYWAVRYIPALVDDPIYFEADIAKMDKKVQSGEGIDSPKYISLGDVVKSSIGRILWFLDEEEEIEEVIEEVVEASRKRLFPTLQVQAAEADDWDESMWDWTEYDEVYIEPGTDQWHPIMTVEEFAKNPVKVRASIYKYYVEHIRLFGKRTGEDVVWVSKDYSAPHAHNIFLQIAGDFGAIAGVLFLGLIIVVYNTVCMSAVEKRNATRYYRLFVMAIFTTITIGFGMLEMCWLYGQLPFTLLFFVQYSLYKKG